MFGKTAGNFQYPVRPCQHWGDWKRGNGKREKVEKWRWKTRNRYALPNSMFNKNIWRMLPVPRSLKLSIWHFATNVVMLQFKIVIILITTFSQCSRYKSPQSVINAAYNFRDTRSWITQLFSFWYHELSDTTDLARLLYRFVSLAIQRLP